MIKKYFFLLLFVLGVKSLMAQAIQYVDRINNENHEEIGYWFISPDLIPGDAYLKNLDTIAEKCPYTLLFLTARDGANFYEYEKMHPVFKKLVAKAHAYGLKVGLQLWGNYQDKAIEGSQRMIIENEVELDPSGKARFTAKAKFIRFPDRLLKTDLFRVYAFKKTGEGFYDPSTLKDITAQCETGLPDKETVIVNINGGESVKGMTACIMTEEYCSQSSMWGDVEINGFTEAMQQYSDIPFDGFALDEYGNKFVARSIEQAPDFVFRGQWYSTDMAAAFQQQQGEPLDRLLFDTRYAPQGQPEKRMRAISHYMDFMRGGALRVETAVYKNAYAIFGKNIFTGIHDTYHNSLVNDEIWANGISWWRIPTVYGQTDEKTSLPVQMGVAMAHKVNAMYNQFYSNVFPPVQEKALTDLRYGVRTHYHALHDKRPNRFDLQMPMAIEGINKVENCSRLLNRYDPELPDIRLLVVFGREALQNWYPNEANRGVYDINDKLQIEEKAKAVWAAGYMNALVPSDLIEEDQITINKEGKAVLNGHVFDAVLYLYPQFAKEKTLSFLEAFEKKGGRLMLEGKADHDFNAINIEQRFNGIYKAATVQGFAIGQLANLGLEKNLVPDGCRTGDGSYVFTDIHSLRTGQPALFRINIEGDVYEGQYTGMAIIRAGKQEGVMKMAAAGFRELKRNGKAILCFKKPVDIFLQREGAVVKMTLVDKKKSIRPLVNKL